MAAPMNLPSFPEFELHPRETAPTRFEKYVKRVNNLFAAMNITKAAQKKAMLLHYMGEETCDVFETLTVPGPPEGSDLYETTVKALADHFEPQKCVDHHVYVFQKETQKAGENITEFYTRLQLLAQKCEFANPELEIKPQIIQGTSSVRLRRKGIEQSLSLENLLKTARAMETTDEQTSGIEKQQSHAVTHGRNKPFKSSDSKPKANPRPKRDSRNTKCGLCGGNYPHQGNCPAQGKQCLNCDKMHHFSKVCRSKPKNHARTTDPSKPSPGRHHARTLDTESPSGDDDDHLVMMMISTLTSMASDGSDNSEEYTFQIDGHDPKTIKPIFSVQILDTPPPRQNAVRMSKELSFRSVTHFRLRNEIIGKQIKLPHREVQNQKVRLRKEK